MSKQTVDWKQVREAVEAAVPDIEAALVEVGELPNVWTEIEVKDYPPRVLARVKFSRYSYEVAMRVGMILATPCIKHRLNSMCKITDHRVDECTRMVSYCFSVDFNRFLVGGQHA